MAYVLFIDPDSRDNFGPLLPGYISIPYDDVNALKTVLEKDGKNIAAFLVEPIQGNSLFVFNGVIVS